MKRKRDNNSNNEEEDEKPQIGGGTKRINFAISPQSTSSSNTTNILNLPLSSDHNDNDSNNNNIDHIANKNIIRSINAISNKEQDSFLPIANVGRIMKKVIPGNGKISKDAKETVQECVSEFISFVTGEASDKCQREKRKTINGDDILWAIMTLGFEDYASPLKVYLQRYRDIDGEKMNTTKQQQQQQQQQQRVDQRSMMNDQQSHGHSLGYNANANNVYSTTNLMSQPSFMANDHPFPLPFSQNSIQNSALPQQDHVDEQW